ncbi:RNA-binding protein 10 isoform X1 [Phyllopteryx taeniolatus]|uniref:RNA-binding protein 10 isoform X1 n=1 Tax=Phyllopteryx taeniolatus TaxID=161469 RepID=UPI002AD1EB91|nr:RNA-binding protein 10 isoform X1 [Phyllopteryx taeniolatus]
MDTERSSGGRGDRMGRYGNTNNDHNFRDMDYRGFGQEDEETEAEYDVRIEEDSPYVHNETSLCASKLLPGHLQDQREFLQRGDGSSEAKALLWPPSSQSSTDVFDEERSKRDFERLRTGSEGRAKGKHGRSFAETSSLRLSSGEGNWGRRGGTCIEQMEHNFDRHREDGRFSHGAGRRKMFPTEPEEHGRCSSETDLSHEDSEQRDQDYRADLDYNQRPSNIVMLRMLPPNATANEIWATLQEQGIQPKEVRLMRNKASGQSRGFAFVEFNLIQEATRWMETNQGVLMILGHRVSMHYSNPKPRANEDWLCNKCGVQNFKRRERCFKCSAPKSEAELKLPQLQKDASFGLQKEGAQGLLPLPAPLHSSVSAVHSGQVTQQADVANDTLILRNLGPHTSVEAILSSLASFATLSPSNIRLIKDKHTHLNRGFAFLQLSTIVEASQLLQILQALKQPLSVDGKVIVVEFAKGSKRDVFLTDGSRVSAATVASTAIAAAQWAVTQTAQNGSSGGQSTEYREMYQQGAAITYIQEGNGYSLPDGQHFQVQTESRVASLPSAAAPLKGTYPAATTPAAVIPSETLASGTGVVQQPPTMASATQVEIIGKPQPAASSQPATPGTAHELQQYPVPDVTTYQYDEGSGYYYDPLTGLYYDPNSQYYYNTHTQQFMYWEGDKHTYIPAASGQSNTEGAPAGDCAAPADSVFANLGSKEKKDKPKSKTAQQIAKDMERWAKTLNRHKENMRSVSSSPAAGSTDRRESASADAGYAVLEKKGALLERPQMFLDHLRQTESPPPQHLGLVPAYSGESDSEEEGGEKDEKEGRMTDWVKLACLLCRRQFPSKEALIRHQQLSELHKQNLEQRRMQEDAGKESRTAGLQAPDSKKRKLSAMDGITGSSLGARMLQGGMKKGLLLRSVQME